MRFEHWIYSIPLRIRSLFHRDAVEHELDDELQFHLDQKTQHYIDGGLAPEEARRRARRDIDGLEIRKEQCRDARRVSRLEDLIQDLRFSVRTLRKSPAFTTAAVLTLALGIGANAAIFSVVNAVLLRWLPYPNSEQLFTLQSNQSLPDLEDIQKQTNSFAAIGGITKPALDFIGQGEPVQIYGGLCNAELFDALGFTPVLGRAFSPAEDSYGGPALVVLTHGFWTRYFGGDAAILGKSIRLSGNSYTVIGVLPREFWLPGRPVDVLASLRVVDPSAAKERGVHFLHTFFRLKPSISIAQASAEMGIVDQWLALHYPEENTARDFTDIRRRLLSLQDSIFGDVRPELLVLSAAVGLVLLIACVNFASLQLARCATRQREIAIRAALGAPSGRLIRQMLTESVLLSLLGGAAGLVLAALGVRFLMTLTPADLPRIANTSIDTAVLGFTFAVSLLTGIVFGLVPALSATLFGVSARLKEDARTTAGGASGHRLRKFLVVSEIALALVLLISAGLMIRSFALLHRIDPGFRADNLLTMRLQLPEARYREQTKQRQFHRELLDELNSIPGVQAALVSELPMTGDYLTHNFVIEGRPRLPAGSEPEVQTRTVAGDYFRIMGIPLLSGRDFGPQDRTGGQHVALVNRAFVAQYFPGQDAVGARIDWARSDPPDWMTIVGVVGDIKHFGPSEPEEPAVYDLYSQTAQKWKRWMYPTIRGAASPGALLAQVKERLWAIDNQLPVTQVFTMNEIVAASLDHQRFNLTLLGIFAAVALALAVVGIYGVMSYAITQRTNEIGIRVALGAQHSNILWLILGQGLRLTLVGGTLGIVAAFALTRYMSHLLFGISPRDPQTFVAIPFVLFAVALLACYIPARRAMRVDPIVALRYE
jgi:putative ABC transport system permease protein